MDSHVVSEKIHSELIHLLAISSAAQVALGRASLADLDLKFTKQVRLV